MKKLFLSTIACLGMLAGFCQAGRIRITLVGAQCNRETLDDMMQLDGKGDEVFFNFNFVLADPAGNAKLSYQKRTKVYGDNHGVFTNRINAGSAVDLFGNLKGGIKGGDVFYCNELMGEYDMDALDVLTITPTIWEWDGGSDIMGTFTNAMNALTRPIGTKAAQLAGGLSPTASNVANIIVNADQFLLPNFMNIFQSIAGKPGDRPIGITTAGTFGPKQVVLRPNYITTVVNSNLGYGAGVLSVNYDEEALGNNRDHGNYTILIKIEYMPRATPSAPPPPANRNNAPSPPPASTAAPAGYVPPPPAATGTKTTTVPPPPASSGSAVGNLRKLSAPVAPSANFSIAGTWAGTFGNGQSNTPNFYSFRINTDGTIQVLNNSGQIIGNGRYTFTNNQFTATYSYTNGGSTFSVAAMPDANGVLNGTWGSGSNVSGSGKWIMTRK